jgi:transcriptional regulator with XRE-family HTH domain
MAVLLREAIGDRLRYARTTQHRTLREVSRTARVSLGYLSEIERGRKEASSELLASICEALALPIDELLRLVASDMAAIAPVMSNELAHRAAMSFPTGHSAPTELRPQPALSRQLSVPSTNGKTVVVAA